jgi:hypothetical protein
MQLLHHLITFLSEKFQRRWFAQKPIVTWPVLSTFLQLFLRSVRVFIPLKRLNDFALPHLAAFVYFV